MTRVTATFLGGSVLLTHKTEMHCSAHRRSCTLHYHSSKGFEENLFKSITFRVLCARMHDVGPAVCSAPGPKALVLQCALYSFQCKVWAVQYALICLVYNVQCRMYIWHESVQCTVLSVKWQCIVCTVQCTMCSLQCVMLSVWCTLCSLQSKVYIVPFWM